MSSNISYFSVSFGGEIESVSHTDSSDGLFLQYQLVTGSDWELVRGEHSGVTQTSAAALNWSFDGAATFNHPLSAQFRSTNIAGWPRIVVTLYGLDACRRRVVKGYGSVSLPTIPGSHVKEICLFKPQASSVWRSFMGWVNGRPPVLTDPASIALGEGREALKVISLEAVVKMNLHVMWKDYKSFDLSLQ